MKSRILLADDEVILTNSLKKILTEAGYDIVVCNLGSEMMQTVVQSKPNLVLLDIYYGESNGLQLLKEMRQQGILTPVIMITAHSDVTLAVDAMKQGASDFIVKPFELNHLKIMIERTLETERMKTQLTILQQEVEEQRSTSGIIGISPEIAATLDTARRLAKGESTTVLLEGESGTGKELFARYICQQSARAEKPFITVNCGAIPKDLAESEFFGYEKGAFTGATERMKQGKFELADGGTILLDEIGELSLDMQVKLLRVLEGKRFYRLGGTKELEVDVRVIAASNRDLAKEVEASRFREDLFYRLNVAVVKVPPLRARRGDVVHLAGAFIQEFAKKFNKPVPTLSPDSAAWLAKLRWKGNVRELRNAMERVVLLNDGPAITIDQFHFLKDTSQQGSSAEKLFLLQVPPAGIEMKHVLKELILQTLAITNGNQVQAAKVLGITRSRFRYRMEQLGIRPQERSYKVLADA